MGHLAQTLLSLFLPQSICYVLCKQPLFAVTCIRSEDLGHWNWSQKRKAQAPNCPTCKLDNSEYLRHHVAFFPVCPPSWWEVKQNDVHESSLRKIKQHIRE